MKYSIPELRFKKNGLERMYFLTKYILGYNDLVERVHGPLCDFLQNTPGRILDMEPRDTFKTTCGSVGLAIWLIIKYPNIRILISHKSLSKSKEIVREIRDHLEHNETFIKYYGNHVGEPWGDKGFKVSTRTNKTLRENTVTAGSVDHEITSNHFDIHINDDLSGLKDQYSKVERERVLRYYKALKYLRDKGKFIKEVNICTRWHIYDLPSYQMGLKDMHVRIKKALIRDKKGNEISYFPERYSKEDLIAEREEDPINFASQRQNDPRPADTQLYNADNLNYFDIEGFKPGYNMAYIDPAFGRAENNEPCYFSMPIGSKVKDNLYIMDWLINKKKPEFNEQAVAAKIEEHDIKVLAVETNAAQSEFLRNVKRVLKNNGIMVQIQPITNTGNKDVRIQAMHGTVVNNLYIRQDWDQAYPEAMQQLLLYPQHNFKDAPDSLAGLINIASGKTPKKNIRIRRI